jgi:hypothetical protein
MLVALLMTVLSGAQSRVAHVERVDLLEVNHYRVPSCESYAIQIIAWEWDAEHRRYNVVAWMMQTDEMPNYPRQLRSGYWRTTWINGCLVEARIFRETWTEYDPERHNAIVHPEACRRHFPARDARH